MDRRGIGQLRGARAGHEQVHGGGAAAAAQLARELFCRIDAIGDSSVDVRMPFRKDLVRAGNTIAGPALMGLADTTAYILTLLHAGPVHDAATANLDIHFLARPEPADVVARARLLRLGRRLCVCAIELHAGNDLVAHATVSYALPSSPGR